MAKRSSTTRSTGRRRASSKGASPAAGTPATRKAAAGRGTSGKKGGVGRPGTVAKPAAAAKRRVAAPRGAAKPKPKSRVAAGKRPTPRQAAVRARARKAVELFARTPGVEGPSPAVPSSLDLDRNRPSAARSGRAELQERFREHHETAPEMTAGDVDADWESAYSVGDEAPGGDNPTPGQDIVENVGKALGVEYQDEEELKAVDKIEGRDRHRWELDPASSEDYPERTKGGRRTRKK